MLTIQIQLVDHMTKEPVYGAEVTVTLLVTERWQEYHPPENPSAYANIVKIEDPPVEVFSHATSIGLNTFSVSFEVGPFLEGVVEELLDGPVWYDSSAWGKGQTLTRERLYPSKELKIGVAVAGLNRTTRTRRDQLSVTDFSWIEVIDVDFAKAIVGHSTSERTLLWFCWHGTARPGDRFFCEVEPLDAPNLRQKIRINRFEYQGPEILPDPVQTAVIPIDGRPATTYRYLLRLIEGEAGSADSSRILASGEFTTAPEPASSDGLSFVFGSCHEPGSLDCWEKLAGMRNYDLILLVGDQIYADYIDELGSYWLERYANCYHVFWSYWHLREVLRRTPTYMIFDDHEIKDDWGSDPNFERRFDKGGFQREVQHRQLPGFIRLSPNS